MSDKPVIDLPLAGKQPTYALLIGVVIAMLGAGLAIPYTFGSRTTDRVSSAAPSSDLDFSAFDGDGADGSPGGTALDGTATTIVGGIDPATGATGGAGGGGGSAGTPGGAGGGGSSGGPSASGPSPTAAPGTQLTASDQGVTAETIKIGVLLPTSETVGDPSAQSSAQLKYFQAFADEFNEAGGIYGRKIELVTASYDLLDQEEGARAACLELARDHQVFAAVNSTGFGPPGTLCLTREHGVPFLQGSGHPREVYAESGGLYSSNFDNQTRNLANMVWFLDQLRYIKGKKVGVLGSDWIGLKREQEEGIVDTLKQLGYDPFVYFLSGDPVSSQSQVPVAVQQMQSNGVEVVIFGADFINGNSFVQQADSQLYYPGYAAADPWGWSTDFVVGAMPDSFAGAITVTAMRTYDSRIGVAEPAIDKYCREVVEKRTDFTLNRENDSDALYVGSMWACGTMMRVKKGAEIAGPNLTRQAFAAAQGQLGTMEVPYSGGLGTYRPDKLDGANHYRPQSWELECRCWQPLVAGFSEGHYTK